MSTTVAITESPVSVSVSGDAVSVDVTESPVSVSVASGVTQTAVDVSVAAHAAADDPHGDRAYTTSQIGAHNSLATAHGLTASISAALAAAASPSASNPFAVLAGNSRLSIPAITSGKAPYALDTGENSFAGTPDPTAVYGYNLAYNGALIQAGEPAAGWIVEADYNDGSGDNKMEMYAEFIPSTGSGGIRPFMFQYNRDTDALTAASISGNPVRFSYVQPIGDAEIPMVDVYRNQIIVYAPDTANSTLINAKAASGKAASLQLGYNGADSVMQVFTAGANEGRVQVGGYNVGYFFGYNGLTALAIGAQDNAAALTAQVGSAHTAGKGVVARGRSGQTGNLLEAQDSSSNILFAVEADGDIRTSRTAAASTLGSVTAKLAIYNAAGTLVGYVPLYDAIS